MLVRSNRTVVIHVCRTGLGLVREIVSTVKSKLLNSAGGRRRRRRSMSIGLVFVLASTAVFLFIIFIARNFCADVRLYKAVKCLLGVTVLVGVLHQLYCLSTHNR